MTHTLTVSRLTQKLTLAVALFVLLLSSFYPIADALSQDQQLIYIEGINYFDVDNNCSATSSSESIPAGTLPSFIPEPYNGAFTEGANKHNVAPALVAALFSEEHNLGGSETDPNTASLPRAWAAFVKSHPNPNSGWASSSAGAQGPFQFEPATFTGLGYDINDINNLVVSADAAAKYAQNDGATKDKPESTYHSFIYSYNHADWYVNAVLKYYDYYNGQPASTPPAGASTTVSVTDSSCTSSTGIYSGGIVQTAVGLAWPDETHGTTPTPAYADALQKYNPAGYSATNGLGDDCGIFVATVMHASGADPNYPASSTVTQANYVISHPDKYQIIYPAASTSQLQPGDILIINQGTTQDSNGNIIVGNGAGAGGHTMIYTGPQPPHGYNEASASLGDRSAGMGMVQLQDPLGRGYYLIARLK